MVPLSPLGHRMVKKVNANLLVAVTYSPVPDLPTKIDCTVEFINTRHTGPADDEEEATDKAQTGGWFRGLWSSEKTPLSSDDESHLPLLLGYVQMVGFVRLNHNLDSASLADTGADVLWKNADYLDEYKNDNSADKVNAVLQTPFFKDRAGPHPKKGKIGGLPDLQAKKFDKTSAYLLHDLFFGFNSMELPTENTPLPSDIQQEALAEGVSESVAPFYVTSQHLLFTSLRLSRGKDVVYKVRADGPGEAFPPSYNMKLTGSAGDGGVLSIGYSFVVGVLEEIDGVVTQRLIYFPLEHRPGKKVLGREWLQQDYLQESVVRQDWAEECITSTGTEVENRNRQMNSINGRKGEKNTQGDQNDDLKENAIEKRSNGDTNALTAGHTTNGDNHNDIGHTIPDNTEDHPEGPQDSDHGSMFHKRRGKFLQELDTLIERSVQVVGANERRKSSVVVQNPAGYVEQIPNRLKILYLIRVNNQGLCDLTLSKPYFRVGDDMTIFFQPPTEQTGPTKVVGATIHIEAHEIFHLGNNRSYVNIYKVTPTQKCNLYAEALATSFSDIKGGGATTTLNVPLFLAQQFQASTLMDLKYFLVCRFVLNNFDKAEGGGLMDEKPEQYIEFARHYEGESESTDFMFLVPLTILP